MIRTFTAQLAELRRSHRDEVDTLKHTLETAHGENLGLRRQLGDRHPSRMTETP